MLNRRNFLLGSLMSYTFINYNNLSLSHDTKIEEKNIEKKKDNEDALIIVDVQNDFLPRRFTSSKKW